MIFSKRFQYYRRIAAAYLSPLPSHLDFWHEPPEVNPRATYGRLGEYYMPFARKADYAGAHDGHGIPLLNYRGAIGLQYNPIAIAQYGLGNYNRYCHSGDARRRERFLGAARWLLRTQERNAFGLTVWNHHFDWEYRTPLKAPWYSGLAQGQAISLLVRAYQDDGEPHYLDAARMAFACFLCSPEQGGVTWVDEAGNPWFEEYIASPPTHILNGFIWASWGVYDYFLATSDAAAEALFSRAMDTLENNLQRYDAGFWSLYEQSGTRWRMLASPFYHSLHIVQLRILHRMTGREIFLHFARRWEGYLRDRSKRLRAVVQKSAFKLAYY